MAWCGGGTAKQEESDGTGGRRVEGIDPVINMSVVGAVKGPLKAPKDMKLKKGEQRFFLRCKMSCLRIPNHQHFTRVFSWVDVSSMAKWRERERCLLPPHFLSHLAVCSVVLSRG